MANSDLQIFKFYIYFIVDENSSDRAIDLTKSPASTFSVEETNDESSENEKICSKTQARKSE